MTHVRPRYGAARYQRNPVMTLATIITIDGPEQPSPTPAPVQPLAATTDEPRTGGPRKSGSFAGVGAGYTMVAAALLGLGIGYLIDALNGTQPLWTILTFFLFLIAGTWQLIKAGRT